MFLIDFEKGELIPDEQLKAEFANERPYRQWIDKQELLAKDLNGTGAGLDADTLLERMQAFGYTTETMQFICCRWSASYVTRSARWLMTLP